MTTETKNQVNKPELEKFLLELSVLSNKYNLYIGGCGCCGSPYISTIDDNLFSEGDLIWENLSYENSDKSYHVKQNDE